MDITQEQLSRAILMIALIIGLLWLGVAAPALERIIVVLQIAYLLIIDFNRNSEGL